MQRTICLLGLLLTLGACRMTGKKPLFTRLSADQTGIRFANTITESDTLNALTYDYLYNGGGVGVGDFNRDGLADLFFSGNMVSAKLYLNRSTPGRSRPGRGDRDGEPLHFEDVTERAGTQTTVWGTGVAVADVNADGWPDIYLSVAGKVRRGEEGRRADKLFINQGGQPSGKTADGVPRFREMAAEYGLAETGYTTQAVFFDYDHDGDLDVYLCTNALETLNRNDVRPKRTHGEAPSTDRLYRNEGVVNNHPVFRDVSTEAGITIEGYGLGIALSDLNHDGWLDIYVANDFLTNDLVWINNQKGGFTNQADTYLKHTSYNGMGVDIADITNDTLPEIMVVDMLPPTNERKKMMLQKYNYDFYQMARHQGYQDQYIRNTLQWNQGLDANGKPMFSEVGQLAGVSQTDWSWAPLFADFDNDGFRDLIISNGYRRDITNLDFVTLLNERSDPFGDLTDQKRQQLDALYKLPEVKLHSFAFHNRGTGHSGLPTFTDVSEAWGLDHPSFSNGAAYADLDNDGDLDLVFNNIDEEAGIYQNTLNDTPGSVPNHYVRLQLPNNAVGTKLTLRLPGGQTRFAEVSPYRGFQSSVESVVHFGLGSVSRVERLDIQWPDGRRQTMTNVAVDRLHQIHPGQSSVRPPTEETRQPLFTELKPAQTGLDYVHREVEFVDFKRTALLPQQYSKGGPCVAVADVDGNGLDDLFFGGDIGQPRYVYRQALAGKFVKQPLFTAPVDDTGALFFDADGDGDSDLYVVSGGSWHEGDSPDYQDRLYRNDGGNFTLTVGVLPAIRSSGSCVVAADMDHDGDLDLFRAGRLVPGQYPNPARSYLLRNDSAEGRPGHFTDVTAQLAPELLQPGLVCAALWTDYDNDGWLDLALAGEWMPLTFYKNRAGKLALAQTVNGPDGQPLTGWFNSIAGADFDGDGDTDYLLGNFGENTRYHTSPERPLELHVADYDNNGRLDPVLLHYQENVQYPVALRDVMVDQMVAMRKRFPTYAEYAQADYHHTFTREEAKSATVLPLRTMASQYVENVGGTTNGGFRARPLPIPAQLSTVFGIQTGDVNADGLPDAVLVGNNYALDPQTGRSDASYGLVLLGNGRGQFRPLSPVQSGICADGDAKSVVQTGNLLVVTNNNGPVQVFRQQRALAPLIPLRTDDVAVLLSYRNGRHERRERYYGSGYLSQSGWAVRRTPDVVAVTVIDSRGRKRQL